MNTVRTIEENAAAAAFSKQSAQFDLIYSDNTIIRYKRQRVRDAVQPFLTPSSTILELNAGTGEDAIYFAEQGHNVHATDISDGMQQVLKEKVKNKNLEASITTELCSFTALDSLKAQGPYDMIFSNFAGLNCTGELEKVLRQIPGLLKPNGVAALVVLPRFCFWEFLLLFRGKFKTAFRRFSGKRGTRAKIGNEQFLCWYYNPSFIRKHLGTSFEQVALEGLCTIVPPSYIENFAERRPRLYHWLVRKENKWKTGWPWRSTGDYYIIILRKKLPAE